MQLGSNVFEMVSMGVIELAGVEGFALVLVGEVVGGYEVGKPTARAQHCPPSVTEVVLAVSGV